MDPLLAWGIGLLVFALVLLLVELFVPSGGVIGAGALVAAIAGVVALFRFDVTWGAAGSLVVLVAIPASFVAWVKIFPSTPIGRAMMGGDEPEPEAVVASTQRKPSEDLAVGTTGQAATDLHPVGYIEIEGVRLDAVARGGLIDVGESVVVVSVRGMQIEVERAETG